MLKPKLALESRLIRDIFPKWWCKRAHDVCGYLYEERHEEKTFAADTPGKAVVVDDDVEYGFGQIRVEFCERV
jgi:hypothetical protein